MPHVAESIAAAVAAAVGGLATTGSRVYRGRDTLERPLQDAELPGLVVLLGGETSEIDSLGNKRVLERERLVHIDAHVKAASGTDTTLTQILLEVEVAIAAGGGLGGSKYGHLAEVSEVEESEGAESPIARQRFTFAFLYYTTFDAPGTAL